METLGAPIAAACATSHGAPAIPKIAFKTDERLRPLNFSSIVGSCQVVRWRHVPSLRSCSVGAKSVGPPSALVKCRPKTIILNFPRKTGSHSDQCLIGEADFERPHESGGSPPGLGSSKACQAGAHHGQAGIGRGRPAETVGPPQNRTTRVLPNPDNSSAPDSANTGLLSLRRIAL
jgi:hypothetical protein